MRIFLSWVVAMGPEIVSVNIIVLFLSCFTAGIIASLSPCVYPVIPLVVGYIGSNANNWKEGLIYGMSFVLGLSIIYVILGLLAGTTGAFLGKWAGSPVWAFIMATVCFWGAFHYWGIVRIPSLSLQQNLENELSAFGAFLIGAGSAVMATACTSPIVLTILSFIAGHKTGPLLGAFLLFVFSLGMASVYLLVTVIVMVMKIHPKIMWIRNLIYKLSPWILFFLGVYFVFKAGRLM